MNSWLVYPQQQARPQLRLFCFAYAGGSAWVFRHWAQQLPTTVEVCAIELPGRGKRLTEPALSNLTELIQTLGPQLLPSLNLPFAFFGHSMGALIAFELCQWLRQTVQLTPSHVWVSAARAPHLPIALPLMHTLPEADFIDRLKSYQGTPTSVLSNGELMSLILPMLRADFTLLETYCYQPKAPLNCPMTGLWGQQDTLVTEAEVAEWRQHASQFSLESVSGDHFFMQQPLFVNKLLSTLAELVA
jgi:medium-chain acyl-[acyl-carrier-protein] hydrolase